MSLSFRWRVVRPAWLGALVVAVALSIPVRAVTWTRVATEEVEVITPLSAKEAGAWASEFAQYVAALRAYFNRTKVKLPALTIVLFGRESEFERYYPLIGPGGKPQELEGYFTRHESWAVVGLTGRASLNARRTIFHEGVHWFLSTSESRNAVWMEEGLAEVFSTFTVSKDSAEWGKAISEHVWALRPRNRLPLEKLVYTAQGDLFGNDDERTGIVYAESWAFVHFLLFGKHDIPRSAFGTYTAELAKGAHPDKAFETAFGRTYAQMDVLLGRYLDGGEYYVSKRPLTPVPAPTARPATPLEVENALGRLALAGKRWPQAIKHARAAIAAADKDPRGHELLAMAMELTEDLPGALAEYQIAIDRGSTDFRPYYQVAAAAHNAAVDTSGDVAAAEARKVADQYEKAINYYPRFRATFENLAGVIGVAEPQTAEDKKFLEFGLKLFPDSGMIELGIAQFDRRSGDRKAARARLDRVLAAKDSLSLDSRQFAQRLDTSWEQEDIGKHIDELTDAKKFEEAVAYIDERLAQGVESSFRLRLKPVRDNLEAAGWSQAANTALQAQEWGKARAALGKLLAVPSLPFSAREQARRTLADLDRQKLGLDAKEL